MFLVNWSTGMEHTVNILQTTDRPMVHHQYHHKSDGRAQLKPINQHPDQLQSGKESTIHESIAVESDQESAEPVIFFFPEIWGSDLGIMLA